MTAEKAGDREDNKRREKNEGNDEKIQFSAATTELVEEAAPVLIGGSLCH